MSPSISKHRFSSSPKRSTVSTRIIICKKEPDFQFPSLSPPSKTGDLPPLTSSVAAITNLNIIEEDEDMLAESQHTEGVSRSFASEDGCGENCVSLGKEENGHQEYDSKYGYGGPSAAMIIDNEDDKEIEDSAKYEYGDVSVPSLTTSSYSPSNENSRNVFCPERMPRRSSMKGSFSQSLAPRRASICVSEHFEVFLPQQKLPVQRRRTITFDNRVNVQKVEPARLLAADPQSLWFQEIEYESMKMKTLAILDRVDHSSGVIDGKKYCTRGLEKFMAPDAIEIKKHQAWDCVLSEQFLQRNDGEFDEETLANIYRHSTKRSQNEASKRGSLDAKVAQAILKTTFRSLSM